MATTDTRQRLVETSAELLRRQGYKATGVKQIVEEAGAAFGSLYHFFPGGKEQLGAEAIRSAGADYEQLIPATLGGGSDIVTGVRRFFAVAGERLARSGYTDACPIATVALEVSGESEVLRQACVEVFERWLAPAAAQLAAGGAGVVPGTERTPGERALELAVGFIAALEGAFVLARASRSTEPLRIAGEMVAEAVASALTERPG